MLKNFRDKIALTGISVLMIGVILLIFTFVSAYGFLTKSFSILASEDLVQTFGEALAPLIGTCIHIMYLGVMGWIGSLLTVRGVTIVSNAPKMPPTITHKPIKSKQRAQSLQRKTVEKPQETRPPENKPQETRPPENKPQETRPPENKPQETRPPENKPSEPEFVIIPPETISQTQQVQQPEQTQQTLHPPQQTSLEKNQTQHSSQTS
jgi:hypothetical protein